MFYSRLFALIAVSRLPPTRGLGNRPYSRHGYDGQKERLGWQIYRKFARQYVNSIVTSRSRDVTSLFRHLPHDVLFKKTRHCFNI